MDWLIEDDVTSVDETTGTYKVLIVDDEVDVHTATKMALGSFRFENRKLEFLSAHSGQEAKAILKTHKDIAVILLDVVMESDDAGLRVAKYLRTVLGNRYSRVILRTGQPGMAPEASVIREYDIDGYRNKAELRKADLEAVFYTALRAYRDVLALQHYRQSLEVVIQAITKTSQISDLFKFANTVLEQLKQVTSAVDSEMLIHTPEALAIAHLDDQAHFMMAGKSSIQLLEQNEKPDLPQELLALHANALYEKRGRILFPYYVYYHQSDEGNETVFILKTESHLDEEAKRMVELYLQNVIITYENLLLSSVLRSTQETIIGILGSAMETRSRETSNHVRRVGDGAALLAQLCDQPKHYYQRLRLAAQLHDVGKVEIPEHILNKREPLNEEEWEIMRRHPEAGYNMLNTTKNGIIEMAARVAYEHHEYWNGDGYPRGLKGKDISLEGRIVGLVDVFDTLCRERAYKEAWDPQEVREEINRLAGVQFDPELVKLFDGQFSNFVTIFEQGKDQSISTDHK